MSFIHVESYFVVRIPQKSNYQNSFELLVLLERAESGLTWLWVNLRMERIVTFGKCEMFGRIS